MTLQNLIRKNDLELIGKKRPRKQTSKFKAIRVCHIARDIELSGGGEVVKQVATHMAKSGLLVTVITDTRRVYLGEEVDIKRTILGGYLLDWTPSTKLGWQARHLIQILVFSVSSTLIAIPLKIRNFVIFNHNSESLIGQIVVMHNVFFAEFSRRKLSPMKWAMAFINPIRCIRIAKEFILTRSMFNRWIVSVSEQAKSDILLLKIDPERIAVISNGVDAQKYSVSKELDPPEVILNWAQSDITKIILFIGHEWKRKGLIELLHAMPLLPKEYGLVVVGGASESVPIYEEKARDLCISRRVLFAGTWPDIRPFLSITDVFCLPSFYETMPLVALESLAAGVPIVLTKECPASTLIIDSVNGSVTNREPEDIAAAIMVSIELGLTGKGRNDVKGTVANSDWSAVGEAYIDLVEQFSKYRLAPRRIRKKIYESNHNPDPIS